MFSSCAPHAGQLALSILLNRCFYQCDLQCESFALPWVTGIAEEAAAEPAHGVRQRRVMNYVVLRRVFAVVVMDEAATMEFLLCALLDFVQVIQILR